MPAPWDPVNVVPNLETLAALGPNQTLGVLKKGQGMGGPTWGGRGLRDRFTLEALGMFRGGGSLLRARKREDVLDDEQYKNPLMRLFTTAATMWRAGEGTPANPGNPPFELRKIWDAYSGLKQLRLNYAGRSPERFHKMDEILRAVWPLLWRPAIALQEAPGTATLLNLLTEPMAQHFRAEVDWGITDFHTTAKAHEVGFAEGQEAQYLEKIWRAYYEAGGNRPNGWQRIARSVSNQAPTMLPTMNGVPYRRRGLGICEAYECDANRVPVCINGRMTGSGAEDIRYTLAAFHNDEGMMFFMSQICNQGILDGFFFDLTGCRGFAGRHWRQLHPGDPPSSLFTLAGKEVGPFGFSHQVRVTTAPGRAHIVGLQGAQMDNKFWWRYRGDQGMPEMCDASEIGVAGMGAEFVIDLVRAGPAIQYNLSRAEVSFRASIPAAPAVADFCMR